MAGSYHAMARHAARCAGRHKAPVAYDGCSKGLPFCTASPRPLCKHLGLACLGPADPQTPDANVKSDYERFLWNWLAFATRPKLPSNSTGSGTNGSTSGGGDEGLQRCQPLNATACPPGFVCAGSRSIKGCANTCAGGGLGGQWGLFRRSCAAC